MSSHVSRASVAPLIGRTEELRRLQSALDDALAGRGRLIVLSGAPGIGKTRLADEFATLARAQSVRVLWGHCWEGGGAPAYWPWIQSLRTYLRQQPPEDVRRQMGSGAADIAQILPEVREFFPDLPDPAARDPEGARFRLFDAISAFLANAARARPLVLLLDDLHAADVPSLVLLRFLADSVSTAQLLLVALYRDVELVPGQAQASALAELIRAPGAVPLLLTGLSADEVARLMELTTRIRPAHEVARAVHLRTEGNPLFVGEMARLLVQEGALEAASPRVPRAGVPTGIQQVIDRRLGHLSSECRALLRQASVIGREFRLDVLERMSSLSPQGMMEALDQATSARLVMEVPGMIGNLRFAHGLIRECLYNELPRGERLSLHRRAAETLEGLYEQNIDLHLAELAHHSFEAAASDPERALAFAMKAGDRAVTSLAYEEAVRFYKMALEGVELARQVNDQLRCELLLALGDAQARAGDGPEARQTFLHAAALARRLGSPVQLTRAALGYGGRLVWARARGDTQLVPLLEEALGVLEGDSALRARILARLAGALRDSPDLARRAAYGREAVEIAQRLGDPDTLAYALSGLCAGLWWLDNVEQRLAAASDLLTVAQRAGDLERVFEAYSHRYLAYMEAGNMAAAATELRAREPLAEALRQPAQFWNVNLSAGAVALMQGRLEEAEDILVRGLHFGERAQTAEAGWTHTMQLYLLRMLQGRLSEVGNSVKGFADAHRQSVVPACLLAHFHAELEQWEAAQEELERLAEGLSTLHVDNEGLLGLALLADVVRSLADRGRAETIYRLMRAYGHLSVHSGEVNFGAAARYLGITAALGGRYDDAERHFADAVTMNTRMGARPWLAYTLHDWAQMLMTRGHSGDAERARERLSEALDIARAVGMNALTGQAAAALGAEARVPTAPAPRDEAVAFGDARREAVFRREGEYWAVGFRDAVALLKDSKGLRYIARLIAAPGQAVHAMDLVRAEVEEHDGLPVLDSTREAGFQSGFGDAGEMLDAKAVGEYRQRLIDLEEELEEARSWNDPERIAQLSREREFVVRELSAAIGLGGRSRRAGSAAERARVNATRAIKAALQRIEEHHAALGSHLGATVKTGLFCVYSPDRHSEVSWQL